MTGQSHMNTCQWLEQSKGRIISCKTRQTVTATPTTLVTEKVMMTLFRQYKYYQGRTRR